jgi:hypothetical protein
MKAYMKVKINDVLEGKAPIAISRRSYHREKTLVELKFPCEIVNPVL